MKADYVWVAVGLVGQGCFFMRFFMQWLASERAGRSVIPLAFWFFSIAGACVLLTYAIYRRDPVFILGQSVGFFIYSRNIFWVCRERRAQNRDLAL